MADKGKEKVLAAAHPIAAAAAPPSAEAQATLRQGAARREDNEFAELHSSQQTALSSGGYPYSLNRRFSTVSATN